MKENHLSLESHPATPEEKNEYLKWEKELLGLYVSGHPLSRYSKYLKKISTPVRGLETKSEGAIIKVGAIISKIKKILAKNGKTMLFAELEDYTGKAEAVVFAKVLEKNTSIWRENNVVLVSGKVNFRDQSPKILVEEAKEINEEEIKSAADNIILKDSAPAASKKSEAPAVLKIFINIGSDWDKQKLTDLKNLIEGLEKGANPVILNIESPGGLKTVKTPYSVNYTSAMREALEKMAGMENVRVE